MTIALVVTYRRNTELARLIKGMEESSLPFGGLVVVDHADDKETRHLVESTSFSSRYLANPSNPGPGAGWAMAWECACAFYGDRAKRYLFLDDDVVIHTDVHATLVEEMEKAGAGAIAPLLEDINGKLWGAPEPVNKKIRKLIRRVKTPSEALQRIGPAPHTFHWCTGACVMVDRTVSLRVGRHRNDFWMLGEDLEYAMRVAAVTRAVFTCKAVVPHYPRPATDTLAFKISDQRKFLALLQNISYLAFHSCHSAHLRWYLPGNLRRYLNSYGWSLSSFKEALSVMGEGLGGRPAGSSFGRRIRAEAEDRLRKKESRKQRTD